MKEDKKIKNPQNGKIIGNEKKKSKRKKSKTKLQQLKAVKNDFRLVEDSYILKNKYIAYISLFAFYISIFVMIGSLAHHKRLEYRSQITYNIVSMYNLDLSKEFQLNDNRLSVGNSMNILDAKIEDKIKEASSGEKIVDFEEPVITSVDFEEKIDIFVWARDLFIICGVVMSLTLCDITMYIMIKIEKDMKDNYIEKMSD